MDLDRSHKELLHEIGELKYKLDEANETIEAIRTGQVDALVVNGLNGHRLYTLKSADHAYRVFIEKMSEGAVSVNTSGLIVYCNTKFASMVAQPLSKVLGRSFTEFVVKESQGEINHVFDKAWGQEVKSEILLSSGQRQVPVQLSLNSLEFHDEFSLNIIVTDLTHQKQTEKELKRKNEQLEILNEALSNSNHDLQQFASVASHDLQEPLRKIQVFTKFLKDKSFADLPEPSRIYLEKIMSSAQRMKVLILDILTYSKLSAEDQNFEWLDLGVLIAEVLEDFELKIEENNATVEVGPLPAAEVNKGQMRQVFHNLISNALKFTAPGVPARIIIKEKPMNAKELGLSLHNESAFFRISVQDNGIGFSEIYASSIFELFEKLNPKSAFEGSGIGLAIAKKIIDKHHGVIIAKSIEGQGSEFNIILPFKHGGA